MVSFDLNLLLPDAWEATQAHMVSWNSPLVAVDLQQGSSAQRLRLDLGKRIALDSTAPAISSPSALNRLLNRIIELVRAQRLAEMMG